MHKLANQSSVFVPPVNWSVADFANVVRRRVTESDRNVFYEATGTRVSELMALIKQSVEREAEIGRSVGFKDAKDGHLLEDIMTPQTMIYNPLNARGLHAFRALLFHRIAEALVDEQLHTVAPNIRELVMRMRTDGILVFPRADKLFASGRKPLELGGLLAARRGIVQQILSAISGYRRPWEGDEPVKKQPSMRERTLVHEAGDIQYYMHVDAVGPIWKGFAFLECNSTQGPLHFVNGSHAPNLGKLRWLFQRTERFIARIPKPTSVQYARTGPYLEETHGRGADAIRFLGFDPVVGVSSAIANDLGKYGFRRPTPLLTERGITLVIADTSGLHYRGYAQPGAQRHGDRVNLPRKCGYKCGEDGARRPC